MQKIIILAKDYQNELVPIVYDLIHPFMIIADLTQTTDGEREGRRERDGAASVRRRLPAAVGGDFAKMAHITAASAGSGGGKDAANMYRVGDYVSNDRSLKCRLHM